MKINARLFIQVKHHMKTLLNLTCENDDYIMILLIELHIFSISDLKSMNCLQGSLTEKVYCYQQSQWDTYTTREKQLTQSQSLL